MVDLLQWDLKDAFADGISKELDNLILKPLVIFAEENIPYEYFHENFTNVNDKSTCDRI